MLVVSVLAYRLALISWALWLPAHTLAVFRVTGIAVECYSDVIDNTNRNGMRAANRRFEDAQCAATGKVAANQQEDRNDCNLDSPKCHEGRA